MIVNTFFPLTAALQRLRSCDIVTPGRIEESVTNTVLFAREDVARSRQICLQARLLVERAYATLRRDPSIIDFLVRKLYDSPAFVKALALPLARAHGLPTEVANA